jgi:hypothetical protein
VLGPSSQAWLQSAAAHKNKEGVVILPSGLQYKVLKDGAGSKPVSTAFHRGEKSRPNLLFPPDLLSVGQQYFALVRRDSFLESFVPHANRTNAGAIEKPF